ncbi:hypothetical protein GCM10009823_25110 [Brevibacterium salitolerans]|uniref:Uncharacterized protein n=1 Tax=Brevibacterium salitolerans TaxID=1403566 RepID=A0ABP5IKL3_9MICO
MRTLRGEGERGGAADPGGGTGDEGTAVLQQISHVSNDTPGHGRGGVPLPRTALLESGAVVYLPAVGIPADSGGTILTASPTPEEP